MHSGRQLQQPRRRLLRTQRVRVQLRLRDRTILLCAFPSAVFCCHAQFTGAEKAPQSPVSLARSTTPHAVGVRTRRLTQRFLGGECRQPALRCLLTFYRSRMQASRIRGTATISAATTAWRTAAGTTSAATPARSCAASTTRGRTTAAGPVSPGQMLRRPQCRRRRLLQGLPFCLRTSSRATVWAEASALVTLRQWTGWICSSQPRPTSRSCGTSYCRSSSCIKATQDTTAITTRTTASRSRCAASPAPRRATPTRSPTARAAPPAPPAAFCPAATRPAVRHLPSSVNRISWHCIPSCGYAFTARHGLVAQNSFCTCHTDAARRSMTR